MRQAITILTLSFCIFSLNATYAQKDSTNQTGQPLVAKNQKYLNLFIVTPPKKKKLDLAARYNILRGRINGLFQRNHLATIVPKDASQMSAIVKRRLQKKNALIGTLWFDSHGFYKKGYSLFFIGHDELNYNSVSDSAFVYPLYTLGGYTDDNSKIIIGSCYGGATYMRKSVYNNDTLRMNGDSLMIGLGKIFKQASILGSESWVMTKPGLFLKRPSVAGFPPRRLFRDVVYQPVWQRVGQWNIYYPMSKRFMPINTITMDASGNALSFSKPYTS
ncbi:MAG: hypothetical protein ABUT20_63585, partial [Bacteroidota bacterium]